MTAREARREIEREHFRLTALGQQITAAEAAYKVEASKPRVNIGPLSERFDEAGVSRARSRVAALRAECETVELRLTALDDQMPDVEQVRQARTEAEALLAQLPECDRRMTEAWKQFMAVVDALEAAARVVPSAREVPSQIRSQVSDLVTRFDLDVSVPAAPMPDRHDQRIALLVATMVQQVVGEAASISPMTEGTLAKVRAERDHALA